MDFSLLGQWGRLKVCLHPAIAIDLSECYSSYTGKITKRKEVERERETDRDIETEGYLGVSDKAAVVVVVAQFSKLRPKQFFFYFFSFLFCFVVVVVCLFFVCPSQINKTLKWLSSLPILMQCSVRQSVSLFPHLLGFRSLTVPLRRPLGARQ